MNLPEFTFISALFSCANEAEQITKKQVNAYKDKIDNFELILNKSITFSSDRFSV